MKILPCCQKKAWLFMSHTLVKTSQMGFFEDLIRGRRIAFVIEISLKDKSGVGIIVDYSGDYTVLNGV